MYGHRRNHSQPQVLPSPTKSTGTAADNAFSYDDPQTPARFQDSEMPYKADFEDVGLVGRGNGRHSQGASNAYGNRDERERYGGANEVEHVGFAIGGESDEESDDDDRHHERSQERSRAPINAGGAGLASPLDPFDYPRHMSRDATPRNSPLYPPYPSPPRTKTPASRTDDRSAPSPAGTLPPYLTLLPRLSLCVLTCLPLLSLLLIILPSLLSSSTAFTNSLDDMQDSIKAKCLGVQAGVAPWLTGEGEANLWNVMKAKQEAEVRKAVVGSLVGLESLLNDSLTVMEQVINFIIDMYRSLLLCTIEFAVQGTLALLIAAVELISTSVTASLNSIRTSIQSDITSANSLIQTAVESINSVTSLVSVTLSVPQFTVPSLSLLANVTFPTIIQDDLIKLNNSIPDLNELKTMINTLVDTPFEELRSRMNASLTTLIADVNGTTAVNSTSTTNTTTLARLATRSTTNSSLDLCSDIDTSFLSNASSAVSRLSHITAALLVLAFLLLLAALMVWEWYKYKCMVDHAAEVERTLEKDMLDGRGVDGMRLINVVEHPVLERYLGVMLDRVSRDERKRHNIRWFLSYITHITALALLAFGALSLITVQLQMDAVSALRKTTLSESSSAIEAEASSFAATLTTAALGQSQAYADDMNAMIQGWQTKVNEDLFGSWLNTTTVVLNSTLVEFYSEVQTLLDNAFGGTVLAAPINTFVYCILGSKVDNVETALTWINTHSQLTLPVIADDALLLPTSTMQALVTPVVAAATGDGTTDEDSDGVLGKLFDRYLASLAKQRTTAGLFLALYGLIVVIGLLVLIWSTLLADRFMRWRLGRLQRRQSQQRATEELAQSGRGKTWSYTPSAKNQEKALPFIADAGRNSNGSSSMGNEKTAWNDGSEKSRPAERGMRPLFLTNSQTSFSKKKVAPKISYPIPQEVSNRPVLGKHLSSWSTKVTGAAKGMLHAPTSKLGHGGADLDRIVSQRSEQSWAGMEPSPWVDQGPLRTGVSEASSRSSLPSNIIPANADPRHWSVVYPREGHTRYPSADFKPELSSRTPIADSHKWTDSAVRKVPPLGAFANDKQHHRTESDSC